MTQLEPSPQIQGSSVTVTGEEAALRASFTLAALLVGALDLLVTRQVQRSADAVNYHLLAFCAIFCILDTHRPFPAFRTTFPATLCGGLLLVSALIKARGMVGTDSYRHLLALVLAASLAVTAFGFRETGRLWKVWLILALLSAVDLRFREFSALRLHLNAVGAGISANLLLLAGYPAFSQGDIVTVPGGSVKVYGPCSAAIPMLYLLKLAMLALLVFPSRWWQKMGIIGLAIFIALAFNAIRIGVMALLNAAGDHARFDYWHEGTGSNVFSILYMAAFCLLSAQCLRLGSVPVPQVAGGGGVTPFPPAA